MNIFSKKVTNERLIIAIDGKNCRVNYLVVNSDQLTAKYSDFFPYQNLDELKDKLSESLKNQSIKNIPCQWVLGRELYDTYPIKKPNVAAKEIDKALKWQIKELVDAPIESFLVSHYQPGNHNTSDQIVVITTNKEQIESIIEICKQLNISLNTIDIEELIVGHALENQLKSQKNVGFIGEDENGLVFNFYQDGLLSFTRHKKGQFLPIIEPNTLTLDEDEAKQESFLLETQRTLDYVVSQVFRRPIDKLLLQSNNGEGTSELANLINQITEMEVELVQSQVDQNSELSSPSLIAVGAALKEVV